MKTKIIYISGNEVFDVADIRAAFEEVRSTLGLSSDTVLFGVPVDSDDCGIATNTVAQKKPEPVIVIENIEEKIIPILSVLNDDKEIAVQDITEEISENEIDESETDILSDELTTEDTDTEFDTIIDEDIIELEQIINDEIPESDEEKTLEKLLEKMKPLRADSKKQTIEIDNHPIVSDTGADILEQLATEFAETQDEIVIEKKSENSGKIGKLKNILPFKKAKREDSGLMGDLFGWAGIAANDDEFSMPDFFSAATSKK